MFKRLLSRIIDWFYFPFVRNFIPYVTFRYAACGGGNLVLDWVLYAVFYNFLFDKENLSLGFVTISPHIAAFIMQFPITFVTGFWLMKNIAFVESSLRGRTQLFRYLLVVLGSILINYIGLKILVEEVGLYPTPSKMVVTLIAVAFSYFTQKNFTFKK